MSMEGRWLLLLAKLTEESCEENDTNFPQRLQCAEIAMCFLQKWRGCASSLLSNIFCHRRTKVKYVPICLTEDLKKVYIPHLYYPSNSLSLTPPSKMLRQTPMWASPGINLKNRPCAVIFIPSFPKLPTQIYTSSVYSSNNSNDNNNRKENLIQTDPSK